MILFQELWLCNGKIHNFIIMLILENITYQTAKKSFMNTSRKKIKFSIGTFLFIQMTSSSLVPILPGSAVRLCWSGLSPFLCHSTITRNTVSKYFKSISLATTPNKCQWRLEKWSSARMIVFALGKLQAKEETNWVFFQPTSGEN